MNEQEADGGARGLWYRSARHRGEEADGCMEGERWMWRWWWEQRPDGESLCTSHSYCAELLWC